MVDRVVVRARDEAGVGHKTRVGSLQEQDVGIDHPDNVLLERALEVVEYFPRWWDWPVPVWGDGRAGSLVLKYPQRLVEVVYAARRPEAREGFQAARMHAKALGSSSQPVARPCVCSAPGACHADPAARVSLREGVGASSEPNALDLGDKIAEQVLNPGREGATKVVK